MSEQKHVVPTVSGDAAAAAAGVRHRGLVGLAVERYTTAPGRRELEVQPDHLIKVHAGAPVRGSCRRHRFTYQRGEVDLMPAGTTDTWHERDAATSVMLRVAPVLLQRVASDMGIDRTRAGLEPRYHFRDVQIEHIAWALDAERAAGFPGGLLYTDSLGLALAVHLLGRHAASARPRYGLTRSQLDRVAGFIEDHLHEELSLTRLAAVAGMSASHLKVLFKRSTGVPVHGYVIQRRVERARMLLRQGDLAPSQVALEAGFAHQSHMAKWVRRVLGVTPAALAGRRGR